MPWTAKQLKLFRAAAHDPAISRSSGISKADASRMSKEGLKKAEGGLFLKQKVGRQDTKHGMLDLPVTLPKSPKQPKLRYCDGGAVRGRTRGRIV